MRSIQNPFLYSLNSYPLRYYLGCNGQYTLDALGRCIRDSSATDKNLNCQEKEFECSSSALWVPLLPRLPTVRKIQISKTTRSYFYYTQNENTSLFRGRARNYAKKIKGPRNYAKKHRGPRNYAKKIMGPRNYAKKIRGPRNYAKKRLIFFV